MAIAVEVKVIGVEQAGCFEGLRRIEVTTRLVNNEKFVRYRALFPTAIEGGKSVHEIPFGAIERPDM